MEELNVNFIAGMGRSGTTLLLSMLNSDDHNLCIPEIPSSLYLFQSHKDRHHFTENDARLILSMKEKFRYIRDVQTKDGEYIERVKSCSNYRAFAEASYLAIQHPGKNQDHILNIIDKNPIYTFYSKVLSSVFPDCRFVLMVRQPHSYVNSCVENVDPGKKRRNPYFYAHAYKVYAKEIQRIKKRFGSRAMIIQYEELAMHPEQTLEKICTHFRIPFSSHMLDFHQKSYNLKHREEGMDEAQKTRIKFKYGALSQPVNTSRLESWKQNLQPKEIAIISSITNKAAFSLGYEALQNSSKFSFGALKSNILVNLYFMFARRFYLLPMRMREYIRKRV